MQQQPGEYDFFMATPNGRAPGSRFIPTNKFAFIGLIVGVLVVVIGIIMFALNAGKPDNEQQLVSLAQEQTELIRVAEIGIKESREAQPRQLATTTSANITSDLNNLKSRLAAAKIKIKDKTLKAGKNAKTDEVLEDARQNNRFDEVFLKTIQEDLVEYQQHMNAAYRATTNKALKEELKKQYENASLIINVKPEE